MLDMGRVKRKDPAEEGSLHVVDTASARSRASSLVSTSTRFTTGTMPPAVRNARQEFVMVDRPPSLFSIGSQPLPPYQQHADGAQHTTGQAASGSSEEANLDHLSQLEGASDAANAVASHYRGIIQVIDQNHLNEVKRLQDAQREEIGTLRHDIDQAYRREFRAIRQDMEAVRRASALQVENNERETSSRISKIEADMRKDMETVRRASAASVERSEREAKARIAQIQEEMRLKEAQHAEELEGQRREIEKRMDEREVKLRAEYEGALVESSQRLRKSMAEREMRKYQASMES